MSRRSDDFHIAFYLAGADPWKGDRLGSLALKPGLRVRDVLVLDILRGQRIPVCVVLAGGYAPNVHDIVDIHAATTEEVAARTADHTGDHDPSAPERGRQGPNCGNGGAKAAGPSPDRGFCSGPPTG